MNIGRRRRAGDRPINSAICIREYVYGGACGSRFAAAFGSLNVNFHVLRHASGSYLGVVHRRYEFGDGHFARAVVQGLQLSFGL